MSGWTPWRRMVALVDMNAFFASVEQRDRPELRGRPVGVTNGVQGTCLITCSYEARALGVHTGMRLKQARRLCPDLIQCPARPARYAAVSTAIMEAMERITPVMEVFSVDEAFLDLTPVQHLYRESPEALGARIKRAVSAVCGLPCSVGISGDKSTAKFAAERIKPDGLTVIPPWQARERLAEAPVTELCGIAGGIGRFLAERGVHTCGDMARLPVGELGRRFGMPGRRLWLMAQGLDPTPVQTLVPDPGSLGHGKVMPPDTRERSVMLVYLSHMSEKVAARLRRHRMEAGSFFVGLRARDGWIGGTYRTDRPTDDARPLLQLCRRMLAEHWRGEGTHQVQVTALDPRPAAGQADLFTQRDPRRDALNAVMDRVNARYGEFVLAPAVLLQRSRMPNVIAPAWKPHGHRQSI